MEKEDDTIISYKLIERIVPVSGYYPINNLIKINDKAFISVGGSHGTIVLFKIGEKGFSHKKILELGSSYYALKLSDGRFLSCGMDETMTIFSVNIDEENGKIEETLKSPDSDDMFVMCIELSNGNLVSGSCNSSLKLWKKKENTYEISLKKEKILGEDGICFFEISDKEFVAVSIGYQLLFIDSNNLNINSKIENIKTCVSNTSSICKLSDDIIAIGGGYGNGIYLVDIKKKILLKQVQHVDKKEEDINCIFKLKNGIILTAEYYDTKKLKKNEDNEDDSSDDEAITEFVDLAQWKFIKNEPYLIEDEINEKVEGASIRDIIELDNGDFITGGLSGRVRVFRKSGEVIFM